MALSLSHDGHQTNDNGRTSRQPFHHEPIGQTPSAAGKRARAHRRRRVFATKDHVWPDPAAVIDKSVRQTVRVGQERRFNRVQGRHVRRRQDAGDDKRPSARTPEQRLLPVGPEELVHLLGVRVRVVIHGHRCTEDRIAVESGHGSWSLVKGELKAVTKMLSRKTLTVRR